MEILLKCPTPGQIEATIQQCPTGSVDRFKLVSALLKYTIPESYLQLPTHTQRTIVGEFRSVIGLGNLISRVKVLTDIKDAREDVCKLLRAHIALLGQVLMPGIGAELLKVASAGDIREIDKLLFKGKCYSICRETTMKYDVPLPAVLDSLEAYTVFLSQELTNASPVNPFLASLLSLGAHTSFFDYFFDKERVSALKRFSLTLKRFEKKQLFSKYLDYLLLRYLRKLASFECIAALSVITLSFSDTSVVDDLMLENTVSSYNYHLNILIPLLAINPKDHIQKLLATWGNKTLISKESITKQGFRTHLLLCFCYQLVPADAEALMKLTAFVEAISNRLSSLSHQVKSLGVYFADKLSDAAQTARIFEMQSVEDDVGGEFPKFSIKKSEILLSLHDAWDVLETPAVVLPESDLPELSLQPLVLNEESDASDEEDDPSIGTKKKVPKPIYIRDLLAYLSVDVKAPDAYEKRRIALRCAPSLLRQKLAFGTEVSFYAEDLISQLVALTDHYEDKDFETARLNAMIALVVSCPSVTPHVCQLLLTGDYSLQQRLCLLSSMSFAARALRGNKDEIVESSFTRAHFATQMLPESLHKQYQAMDYGYRAIENKLQNELMQEASEKARDAIVGGKVLRMSSKLAQKEVEKAADYSADFAKIVGKRFFFPLVAVWYESGGIEIGHYSAVLIAHYVRTLSLILHCAYPNAVDLNEMAGEFLRLVTPILQNSTVDQVQVLESVITGVLLICEIVEPTYAATNYDEELFIVEKMLLGCWELIIDDRVKSLCAGLLLKLSEMREGMQRTLMGQNAGFY